MSALTHLSSSSSINGAIDRNTESLTSVEFLRLVTCLGLVAGLVEGFGLLAVFRYGWLYLKIGDGVSVEILWICALVDVLLFVLTGLVALALARRISALPVKRVCLLLLVFLTFADWLSITGRIGPIGVLSLSTGLTAVVLRGLKKHEAAVLNFRRFFWFALGILVITFVGVEGGLWLHEKIAMTQLTHVTGESPNVLVIVVDTLRSDHLSLYGYGRATTPNLDRIASQGVVFDNDISNAPWTLPSHASLLTGRPPHEHHAQAERALDNRYPTVAEVLRDRGYRTGGFSGNTYYFCRRAGFARGFLHFEDYFYSLGDMLHRTLWGRVLNRYLPPDLPIEVPARQHADHINHKLLEWIDHNSVHPFFAFVNYYDLHDPYLPKQPYRHRFSKSPNPGGLINADRTVHLTDSQIQTEMDAYDGAISYVDEQIGHLFGELQSRGLDRNTLVVITSDHGEAFGEHNLLCHRNALYRPLIHVPLIYWFPRKIPAGVRIDRPVSGASLPSTVMDLVGAGGSTIFPMASVGELWRSPEARRDWPAPLAEMEQHIYGPESYPAHAGWLKTIVDPNWQLIISEKLPPELYEWKVDPRETKNLADQADAQDVFAALSAQLNKSLQATLPHPAYRATRVGGAE